jgi:hypothetical protein
MTRLLKKKFSENLKYPKLFCVIIQTNPNKDGSVCTINELFPNKNQNQQYKFINLENPSVQIEFGIRHSFDLKPNSGKQFDFKYRNNNYLILDKYIDNDYCKLLERLYKQTTSLTEPQKNNSLCPIENNRKNVRGGVNRGKPCFFVVRPGDPEPTIEFLSEEDLCVVTEIADCPEDTEAIVQSLNKRVKQFKDLLVYKKLPAFLHGVTVLQLNIEKHALSPEKCRILGIEDSRDFLVDAVLKAVLIFPDSEELYKVASSVLVRLTDKPMKEMLFQRATKNITEILQTEPQLSVEIRNQIINLAKILRMADDETLHIQEVCPETTRLMLVDGLNTAIKMFSYDGKLCDAAGWALEIFGAEDDLGPKQIDQLTLTREEAGLLEEDAYPLLLEEEYRRRRGYGR